MRFPWDTAKPLRVEVALNPAAETPEWRDVSPLVKGQPGVRITRGGGDRHDDVPAGRCTFTLDNRTGDYSDTSGMAPSLFRKRVRVSYRTPGVAGNLLSAENASFEGGTTGNWGVGYIGAPALVSIVSDAAGGSHGARSMKITFPTAAAGCGPQLAVTGLVVGRKYTAECRIWTPTGMPQVRFGDPFGATGNADTATTMAWEQLTITWTAAASFVFLVVKSTVATTAGQYVRVDAVIVDEGATAGTFTTAAPPISYRFTGRIATNDLAFPALGLAETALTATDESAWNGSSFSTLRSPIVEESLPDSPAGLWPLTGNDLGDVSGKGAGPMTVSGAGDALSNSGDGVTFAGGTWLKAALRAAVGTYLSPNVTLEAVASVDSGTVTEGTVATVSDAYGPKIALTVGADGKARARTWNVFTPGVWTASVISARAINDGTDHHLAATWTTGTGTLTLWVDGVSSGSAVSTAGTGGIEAFGTHVTAGGSAHSPTLTGRVSHVAAFPAALSGARIAEHAAAVLDGFAGESVADRIDRYNRWAGYPYPTITHIATTAVVGNYNTDGKSITDAINAVATVEDGLAYIAGSGALVIRGRSAFVNDPPAFTIAGPGDGVANRVRNTLSYATNPRTFVNDVTGTMPGGITRRATDEASIAEYGRTTASVEGPFASDQDLAAVIEWRVNTESTPRPTADGLSVRLSQLDDTATTALLALDLGDVIAWTGMPDQAPSTTDSAVVLGIEETYTHADLLWTATTVSATSSVNVLVTDDPVRGLTDSGNVAGY